MCFPHFSCAFSTHINSLTVFLASLYVHPPHMHSLICVCNLVWCRCFLSLCILILSIIHPLFFSNLQSYHCQTCVRCRHRGRAGPVLFSPSLSAISPSAPPLTPYAFSVLWPPLLILSLLIRFIPLITSRYIFFTFVIIGHPPFSQFLSYSNPASPTFYFSTLPSSHVLFLPSFFILFCTPAASSPPVWKY